MLNHNLLLKRTKVEKGSRLEALLKAAPPKPSGEIVEELFLASMGRFPSPEEQRKSVKLLEQAGSTSAEGAEDLLWALLNRVEFIFNH